ncbi:MAG: hypothetical protein FWC41_13695 [Firmicutes bacterium]|nr:hypothetical protein [Bacillota bacterium]
MIKRIIFLLWLAVPLSCMAQDPLPREYSYDAAGNRTSRKVVPIQTPPLAPPPPTTPELTVTELVETEEELTFLQPPPNFTVPELLETEEIILGLQLHLIRLSQVVSIKWSLIIYLKKATK